MVPEPQNSNAAQAATAGHHAGDSTSAFAIQQDVQHNQFVHLCHPVSNVTGMGQQAACFAVQLMQQCTLPNVHCSCALELTVASLPSFAYCLHSISTSSDCY
jgi:hypothetical protein